MNIFIGIDSFKGSADSLELGRAAEKGIKTVMPAAGVHVLCVADGGEGSAVAVCHAIGGKWQHTESVDPFFNKIQASYLLTHVNGEPVAIIECASTIGIQFLQNNPSNSSYTATSYGLGLMIRDALSRNIKHIIITLGGSATTDGGLGLLQALGAKLFDQNHKVLPSTCNPLIKTRAIDFEPAIQLFKGLRVEIAVDVKSPYCGAAGAAHVYGPQKGLRPSEITYLEDKLQVIRKLVMNLYGSDLQKIPGAGAAGGLGGAFALLRSKLMPGFELLSGLTDLKKILRDSDLTGEGSLDAQSLYGKVPYEIAKLSRSYNIPCVALCGRRDPELGELEGMFNGIFSVQLEANSLANAMKKNTALSGAEIVSREIIKLINSKKEQM